MRPLRGISWVCSLATFVLTHRIIVPQFTHPFSQPNLKAYLNPNLNPSQPDPGHITLLLNDAAEEDDTLRNIVSRDGEGKWKEKSEELNYVMASHYEAMVAVAAAKGDHAVQQYGRVAAQCLHRYYNMW